MSILPLLRRAAAVARPRSCHVRAFAGCLLALAGAFTPGALAAATPATVASSTAPQAGAAARTEAATKAAAAASRRGPAAPTGPFTLARAVEEVFGALDLTRPELAAVAAARAQGDLPAARHALAEYFRHRAKPLFPDMAADARRTSTNAEEIARADQALRHHFESIGIAHQFGPRIDWTFDATGPDHGRPLNHEWTWQLNRHREWTALARAYRSTGDEKYAREAVALLTAWVQDCPRPATHGNVPRSAWRTIETGIRASSVWPNVWSALLRSPALTDDALLTFLWAYREHALHLLPYPSTGNWLAMEGNGLFHVGVLFPEFREAPLWRDTAARWIHAELNNQVYPDGVQIELASGYHHVSLYNFLAVFKLARRNDVALPADFLARLEKMYDFDVYGAMPSRVLPPVQDGGRTDVRATLAEAATLYPQRADFRWYATEGREGRPPAATSYAFPWAGYFIMRSGWDRDARWLLFDGGPFGYGHQHEDKLQIQVEAYGQSFLVDPGVFTYEKSQWRDYFIDSPSHNVVLVDGQPQRRRGAKDRSAYLLKAPLPHVWSTSAEADYVEATYDEAFGGDVKRGVTHTRAVLFVKPNFWVVLDRLAARDGRAHTYDALFHFDSPVRGAGDRWRTHNPQAANLTLAWRAETGLQAKIVEGQEKPVQGWLITGSSKARPAPVGILTVAGQTRHLLYVLAPAPRGAADPVRTVEPLGDDPTAARIGLTDGTRYEVRFPLGQTATWRKLP